jgi:hypothetical protein
VQGDRLVSTLLSPAHFVELESSAKMFCNCSASRRFSRFIDEIVSLFEFCVVKLPSWQPAPWGALLREAWLSSCDVLEEGHLCNMRMKWINQAG